MKVSEVENSKIVSVVYQNDKWNIQVVESGSKYSFILEGSSDISDDDLSDLIYYELIKLPTKTRPIRVVKDKLIGTKPVVISTTPKTN